MKIDEKTYKAMPIELQDLFYKCPNQGSNEVVGLFPVTTSGGGDRSGAQKGDFLHGLGDTGQARVFPASTGSAARFFYVAKSSRSDRNDGLDSTYTVKYNVPIGGALCKDVTMALVESLQRATSESTLTWLIGESGENITGLCPLDTLSTTLTAISKITTSQILNSLTPSLTSVFTQAVSYETVNGGNHAESAESSSGCQPTTMSESQELAPGASRVVSEMLLTISDGANWKPLTNIHSTVKPTNLMRYLCKLVTPPGGTICDPFMGSGSTGKAARLEGFKFIGIELEQEYCEIAKRRISCVSSEPIQSGLFAESE